MLPREIRIGTRLSNYLPVLLCQILLCTTTKSYTLLVLQVVTLAAMAASVATKYPLLDTSRDLRCACQSPLDVVVFFGRHMVAFAFKITQSTARA
jgi:hypothetical protein